MTAKTTSINGVTRLHEFEVDITRFERVGGTMQATGKHSEFGLPAGQWPDNFALRVPGYFRLMETKPDGTHVYHCGDNIYTVLP
jgi:hypothetical protein